MSQERRRPEQRQSEREREKYYTYPATRLMQVLPGHPWQIPKDETVCIKRRGEREREITPIQP